MPRADQANVRNAPGLWYVDDTRCVRCDADRRLREILTEVDKDIPRENPLQDRRMAGSLAGGKTSRRPPRKIHHTLRSHHPPAPQTRNREYPAEKTEADPDRDLELELTKEKLNEKGRTKKGMDPIGVEQVHNVLDAALEHAFMMELIGRNPAAPVKPPKCPRKEAFVPKVSQVRALMSEAQQSSTTCRRSYI
ncbi:MAG: hypothetical protein OXL37_05650 [Chloroflexota bacterium]|nr:hypothetical protein [Chloroflexota bacterium]MDE2961068.1 hypothetical protein [Chloroflexota bacterium]